MAPINKKSIVLIAIALTGVALSAGLVSAQENNSTAADDASTDTPTADNGTSNWGQHDGDCAGENATSAANGTDAVTATGTASSTV